jgi:transposase
MNVSNGDYVKGQDRDQLILFPGRIEEYIDQDNAVRVIDEFVDSLDLEELGFIHFEPKVLGGRPSYDPYDLLKLYLYGYLNGNKDEPEARTRMQSKYRTDMASQKAYT